MRSRRAGISLTEVLIAMFIMAVGMIALMTLFPLGAMRIGQSLKDDRCTQLALQTDAQMRAIWRNDVVAVIDGGGTPSTPYYQAMDNPNSGVSTAYQTNPLTLAPDLTTVTSQRPSYPVLVDPYGVANLNNPANVFWLATSVQPTVRVPVARRSISAPALGLTQAVQFSRLLDDYTFEMNGQAGDGTSATSVARQGRYSAAVMLWRDSQADKRVAKMQVLVFDGRPPAPNISDEALADIVVDTANPANDKPIVSTSRQVRIEVKTRGEDETPTVRRGGWLLDGTTDNRVGVDIRRANFHRIVAATVVNQVPPPGNTTYDLDLETDLKALPTASPSVPYQFYFFAGLSEVFDNLHDLGPDQK